MSQLVADGRKAEIIDKGIKKLWGGGGMLGTPQLV
jgi:hypothetical protein